MQVLVINSGSSSVKFELFEMDSEASLLGGEVERIGQEDSAIWYEARSEGAGGHHETVRARDHVEALTVILGVLRGTPKPADLQQIVAVGHRVVHGGMRFREPVRVDDSVLEGIREVGLLAPVHIKANVAGIEAAMSTFPGVCQVAVFDTAFHATLPPVACEYALPKDLAHDHGIRRYGFHGISHRYVANRAAAFLGRPLEELNLITMHLGNGASATAIEAGRSVDTSMGMTPLEGLVMGTRCGDVDPAIPGLLGELVGASREDVNRILNFESGLLGLCGKSDMREVHREADAGDPRAQLALDLYCYRARKYVGAYSAVLGRVDAVVFTAGVGENDSDVRQRICAGLERLGIRLDAERNAAPANERERLISEDGSEVAVLVIPTDEERELARAAFACVQPARHEG